MKLKADAIRWHKFTGKSDAVFRSLGREIRIGVLSVTTLMSVAPACATAEVTMAMDKHAEELVADDSQLDTDSILLQDVAVVATRAAIPADKAVRLVQVLTRKDIEQTAAQTVNDLLKLVAGVDVRQRGPFGIQTDIGVNGGTCDQLTVLLNGVNISNPHTGHLTMDLPTSVDDIERIEVIEGGASRVYGAQAFSGAINIVTKMDKTSNVGANLQGGSFGTWGGDAHLNLVTGKVTNYLSGGYAQSDGMDSNSDFKKGRAYLNGKWETKHFDLRWQGGLSTMDYGANTFYGTGSTTQYEENRRYMASLQGEYKGRVHVMPRIYWTRSLDYYVWRRANPEAYRNFHQSNVYGASVNSYIKWLLGTTSLGFEFRRENILSTRLGLEIPAEGKQYKVPGRDDIYYKYKDGRSNYSIYLEHNVLLRQVSISVGVLANKNTSVSGGMKFYPGVDISWRAFDGFRIYGSFNQSLRVASFTDLYYNGPGIQGNVNLKPEKSTDFSLGMNYSKGLVNAQIKGFYRKGTDMIDWVKREGDNIYSRANSDINSVGAEALLSLDFNHLWGEDSYLRNLSLSYCYNHQYRTNEEQAATYVTPLTFLRHKFVCSLSHRIFSRLSAKWDVQYKNRAGEFDNAFTGQPQAFGSFATLDLRVQWTEKAYTLFVEGNNLTNHAYYDIANVRQPGFWFMGGVKFNLGF